MKQNIREYISVNKLPFNIPKTKQKVFIIDQGNWYFQTETYDPLEMIIITMNEMTINFCFVEFILRNIGIYLHFRNSKMALVIEIFALKNKDLFMHDDVNKWKLFRVTCPLCGPVTRSFDAFFDPHLNKRLSKQTRRRWFETPSCSLWRHYNGLE